MVTKLFSTVLCFVFILCDEEFELDKAQIKKYISIATVPLCLVIVFPFFFFFFFFFFSFLIEISRECHNHEAQPSEGCAS